VSFGGSIFWYHVDNALLYCCIFLCSALRTVQNELRQEVGRLEKENNKLSSEVTQLGTQVDRYVDAHKYKRIVVQPIFSY
jgi:cell division protein FtsB